MFEPNIRLVMKKNYSNPLTFYQFRLLLLKIGQMCACFYCIKYRNILYHFSLRNRLKISSKHFYSSIDGIEHNFIFNAIQNKKNERLKRFR